MAFLPDFQYDGKIDKVETNKFVQFVAADVSECGSGVVPDSLIDNPNFQVVSDDGVTINDVIDVDGSGNKSFKDEYDFVNIVTKYEWNTSDGFFFSGEEVTHVFRDSGIFQVTLSIYSEIFTLNDGRTFQYKNSIVKDITVFSLFFRLLTDNLPLWDIAENKEMSDLLFGFSELFNRIYKDTKGLFDNIDANKIQPELLEFLAATLGHTEDYVNKVAGNINDEEFSEYDIYDRIKSGTATDQEIQTFREFILYSSKLFKTKGTKDDLVKLLSFFNIISRVDELWTKNWGQTSIGTISESFVGLDDFADNKLGFRWLNVRVVGNSNDAGHFVNGFNSIELDNYHENQKLEYFTDVVNTIESGDKEDWVEFEIKYNPVEVLDVRLENGNELSDIDPVAHYDIVPNDPVREVGDPFNYVLQVNPDILEYGDRISLIYGQSQTEAVDSLVATQKYNARNFDSSIKFLFKDIPQHYINNNIRAPENEFFFIFRGLKEDETDIYSSFNQYFRVGINTRRSTFTVTRVVQSQQLGKLITQQINLSSDVNKPIWEGIILDESTGEPWVFNSNFIYEVNIQMSGDHLSVFFRENEEEQQTKSNIQSDIGGNVFPFDETEFTCLVSNLNLNVRDASTRSVDQNGEVVTSQKYTYIDSPGSFGIGVRSGIMEFLDFSINILDPDDRLFNNLQKEIFEKPKYLDSQNNNLIRYNSYLNNANEFTVPIQSPFNPNTTRFELESDTFSSALNFFYFDNAPVTEELASRYTITFDENWVSDNFDSSAEVASKIIVPIGSQTSAFLPELRVHNRGFYRNANGLTESTTASQSPGLFNFNASTTLGKYTTVVGDEFASLKRNENGFGRTLSLNNRVIDYQKSSNRLAVFGIYEEVSPLSSHFTEFDGQLKLRNGRNFTNKVFLPIVVQNPSWRREIGVRFKHCDDIRTIIDRGSFQNLREVQLYGHFTLTLPESSVKFRPDNNRGVKSSGRTGYVLVDVFLPLGILNDTIQNYSLGSEFMYDESNAGLTDIRLNGVYFLNRIQNMTYDDVSNVVELDTLNPFENKSAGLSCKMFLAAEMNLSSFLEDWERTTDSTVVSNKYLMDLGMRKMLRSLEKVENYNSSRFKNTDGTEFTEQEKLDYVFDNWDWWKPSEVWMKRDFERVKLDVDNDVSTGINFNGERNRSFYGKEFTPDEFPNGVKHQQFRLLDGPVTPNTIYYAKVVLRMNWSGYESGLEPENVVVVGGQKSKYENHAIAPTGKCLEMYIPISWYDENDVPSNNTIEWANFIRGVDTTNGPTVTLTPYGLMSWLLIHAERDANLNDDLENMKQVTSGWTLKDWNERFNDLVQIEYIAERVDPNLWKFGDEFGFVTQYAPETGAYVEVDYDTGDLDWYVSKTVNLVPTGSSGYYFSIPKELKPFRTWNEDVRSLKLFNYVLDKSLYEFNTPSSFSLISDPLLNTFTGADFNARMFFDIFFDSDKFLVTKDNFDDERSINWTVYENTTDDRFELATRLPSTSITFGVGDSGNTEPSFDIIEVDGTKVFRRDETSTVVKFDPQKSGSNDINTQTVRIDQNGGFKQSVHIVDDENEVFELNTLFRFDSELDVFEDYRGKHFEHVLKANTFYNPNTNKHQLKTYYFVGVGTFNFDIALGVAEYNFETNKIEKTFLAGFGDFNTKNIKVDTWYQLKTIVNNNTIKVIFNEKDENERLVINYNIDPSRQSDRDRYVKGAFEELVYIVAGFDSLDITYPETLLSKTNSIFYDENWNELVARNTRPSGSLSGMRVFNNLTYVDLVEYKARIQDDRHYAVVQDVNDRTDIMAKIFNVYGVRGEVKFVGKTLHDTIVVQVDNYLFYKLRNKDVTLYSDNVDKTAVYKNQIVVKFLSGKAQLIVIQDDFMRVRNVFVKDSSINTDYIFKYLKFTEREIENVWVSDSNFYVEFADLPE